MAQMTPEQQAEMQEKIKNMSPEELREFQKKNCIFCHIIAGKIPSKKVYSDDKCIAILDINPANPGHLLILPKEHYAVMPQMPADILEHCFVVTKALSQAVLQALGVRGTNVFVANGPAAGQKANHFMVHLIPRREEDGINLSLPEHEIKDSDLEKIKIAMKPAVSKVFELKEKVEAEVVEKKEEKKEEKAEEVVEKKAEEVKEEVSEEVEEKKEEPEENEDIDLDTIAGLLSKK